MTQPLTVFSFLQTLNAPEPLESKQHARAALAPVLPAPLSGLSPKAAVTHENASALERPAPRLSPAEEVLDVCAQLRADRGVVIDALRNVRSEQHPWQDEDVTVSPQCPGEPHTMTLLGVACADELTLRCRSECAIDAYELWQEPGVEGFTYDIPIDMLQGAAGEGAKSVAAAKILRHASWLQSRYEAAADRLRAARKSQQGAGSASLGEPVGVMYASPDRALQDRVDSAQLTLVGVLSAKDLTVRCVAPHPLAELASLGLVAEIEPGPLGPQGVHYEVSAVTLLSNRPRSLTGPMHALPERKDSGARPAWLQPLVAREKALGTYLLDHLAGAIRRVESDARDLLRDLRKESVRLNEDVEVEVTVKGSKRRVAFTLERVGEDMTLVAHRDGKPYRVSLELIHVAEGGKASRITRMAERLRTVYEEGLGFVQARSAAAMDEPVTLTSPEHAERCAQVDLRLVRVADAVAGTMLCVAREPMGPEFPLPVRPPKGLSNGAYYAIPLGSLLRRADSR